MSSWKSSRATFWIAVLFVGPLALPLLWKDANYSQSAKWLISIGVIIFTIGLLYFSAYVSVDAVQQMQQQINNN